MGKKNNFMIVLSGDRSSLQKLEFITVALGGLGGLTVNE